MEFALPIIVFSYFTQAVLGFGGGIISIAILGHSIGIEQAVLLVLPFDFLMCFLLLGCYRKIRWQLAIPIGIGVVLGTFLGMWMLTALPERALRVVFGLCVLLFLGKDFLRVPSLRASHPLSILVGIGSGVMQGVGVGGPILIVYFLTQKMEKKAFRATLLFLFFVSNIFRVLLSLRLGLLTPEILTLAGSILPWFFGALLIGHFCVAFIPERTYGKAVRILLLISAVLLMVR